MQELSKAIAKGFPCVWLYGITGIGKSSFLDQLKQKFLPQKYNEFESLEDFLKDGDCSVGYVAAIKEAPDDKVLKKLKLSGKTLILEANHVLDQEAQEWIAALQVNSLDASQVFALARNYLSDLRELELYHRDKLLTTCAGHPALVKEYLLGFRDLEGSSLSFDAGFLTQKRDDIVRVSIANLGEEAHDLLLHLSLWELPIGFGIALKDLVPEFGREESFLELKQRALLERSGSSHYRVQPLIARYF